MNYNYNSPISVSPKERVLAEMNNTPAAKRLASKQIEDDVAAFLASGGTIVSCDKHTLSSIKTGFTANKPTEADGNSDLF